MLNELDWIKVQESALFHSKALLIVYFSVDLRNLVPLPSRVLLIATFVC